MPPRFTAYIFDFGHPYCGQLTPVKTRYPPTSITWPYRGLTFRAHQAHCLFVFKLTAVQVPVFDTDQRIPCFDNCQINNNLDVQYQRCTYGDGDTLLFFKAWCSARTCTEQVAYGRRMYSHAVTTTRTNSERRSITPFFGSWMKLSFRRIQQIDRIVNLWTRPWKYFFVPLMTWNCLMECSILHSSNRTNRSFSLSGWIDLTVLVGTRLQKLKALTSNRVYTYKGCLYVYVCCFESIPKKKNWPQIPSSPITDGAPCDPSPLSLVAARSSVSRHSSPSPCSESAQKYTKERTNSRYFQ